MIDDHRTEQDKKETIGFVVATDSFMSGWGPAQGRSLFAVPYRTDEAHTSVLKNMEDRKEMKRVRTVGADYRPRLGKGDHLSIRSCDDSKGFYTPGFFHTR